MVFFGVVSGTAMPVLLCELSEQAAQPRLHLSWLFDVSSFLVHHAHLNRILVTVQSYETCYAHRARCSFQKTSGSLTNRSLQNSGATGFHTHLGSSLKGEPPAEQDHRAFGWGLRFAPTRPPIPV